MERTWQWPLNQANKVCRDSRELGVLLSLIFGITTNSEYLSLTPKHLTLHLQKFRRITINTLNMYNRQLMITIFKQNKAGETGEKLIRSFGDEFIRWRDPSKLDTAPNLSSHPIAYQEYSLPPAPGPAQHSGKGWGELSNTPDTTATGCAASIHSVPQHQMLATQPAPAPA